MVHRRCLQGKGVILAADPSRRQDGLRRGDTTLPPDVRSFFALADGIEDGYTDDYLLSFWSIEKILGDVADSARTGYRIDPRDTPIADFLINSWFVYLRRLGQGRVGVWVEGADIELPSLTDFFEQYERDPTSLGLFRDTTYTKPGEVINRADRLQVSGDIVNTHPSGKKHR